MEESSALRKPDQSTAASRVNKRDHLGYPAWSQLSSEDLLMSSRKLNELATDIDDAATVVEELQAEPDVDASEKLDELKTTLEDASDVLDEIHDENYE